MEDFFTYLSSKQRGSIEGIKKGTKEDIRSGIVSYAPYAIRHLKKIELAANGYWRASFYVPLEDVEDVMGGFVSPDWQADALAKAIPGGFAVDTEWDGLKALKIGVLGRFTTKAGF